MPIISWSDTSITVTIPSGATSGMMVVTTASGVSNGVFFTVQVPAGSAPVLNAVMPSSGAAGSTVNITLTGTGLTGTTAVNVTGGTTASNISVVSDTHVTATLTIPSGAASGTITVTTPLGTSGSVPFTVTSLPNPPTGGTTFQLKSIMGGVTVPGGTFNGQAGISLFCTQPWSPSVTLAVGASVYVAGTGSYDGYFTLAGTSIGPDNYGMTLVSGVNANTNIVLQQGTIILGGTPGATGGGGGGGSAPTLTSLSPTSGAVGTSVTISGTNFGSGGTVTFNGVVATPSSWANTSIVAPVPSGATTGNVIVTVAGLASNGVAFTVLSGMSPTLTTITPSSAAANTAAVMTLAGTGFTGATAVNYSGTGITIQPPTVASDTSLSTTFGVSLSATSGNATVTAPGGTSNNAAFSVTAWVPPAGPLINSVSPTSGSAGTAVPITLAGSGFTGNPGIAPTTVGYSGTGGTISSVVVVGDNQITATLTLATGATSGILTVTTPSGTSNGAAFTVSGTAAPPTPAGYLAFIYGGTPQGIYVAVQTPMSATLAVGNTVTVSGTGSYDGTFTVAHISSATDLFLNPGTNSATVIVSKQGLIHYP